VVQGLGSGLSDPLLAMNVMNLRLCDILSGDLQTSWKRSKTVFIDDEGPLNLIGVANTTASAESKESSTLPM